MRGSISRAFSFSRSSFAQESWYNTVGIILFFKKYFKNWELSKLVHLCTLGNCNYIQTYTMLLLFIYHI